MNDNSKNRVPFIRTLIGSIYLGVFICVVGLSFNAFHKNSLPLDYTKMPVPPSESGKDPNRQSPENKPDCEPYPVFIDQAKEIFDAGTSIFIDARLENEYQKGHILGALNIPFDKVMYKFKDLQDQMPVDKVYVIYCGGADCDTAYEVARYLCLNGYKDGQVLVYEDGYDPWSEFGYPSEQ